MRGRVGTEEQGGDPGRGNSPMQSWEEVTAESSLKGQAEVLGLSPTPVLKQGLRLDQSH